MRAVESYEIPYSTYIGNAYSTYYIHIVTCTCAIRWTWERWWRQRTRRRKIKREERERFRRFDPILVRLKWQLSTFQNQKGHEGDLGRSREGYSNSGVQEPTHVALVELSRSPVRAVLTSLMPRSPWFVVAWRSDGMENGKFDWGYEAQEDRSASAFAQGRYK